MGAGLVGAMSLASALAVANNYYCQPLIGMISRDLPGQATAYVPTAAQLGYALGLFLVVPMGDMIERKRMAVGQFLLLAAGLAGMAMAPTGTLLVIAALLVGLATTAAQQIIPFAAALTAPERRGVVIGTIASGAMAGVLLSRTVAGFVGEAYGWRAMYWASIPLALFAAALMAWMLPRNRPEAGLSYGRLMASLPPIWRAFPELRLAAITEGLIFAAYMAFWTTMALHLQEPQIGLGPAAAGTFGLIGVVGVIIAPMIGRFADRRGAYPAIIGGTVLVAAGWAMMGLWSTLSGLVAGVILLDAAARTVLIASQARVFAQETEARSRLNTIFIGSTFMGGTIGSALAMTVYQFARWDGVAVLGTLLAGSAAALQVAAWRRRSRAAT
jgi:predicted MFS family arabinose efflux permease